MPETASESSRPMPPAHRRCTRRKRTSNRYSTHGEPDWEGATVTALSLRILFESLHGGFRGSSQIALQLQDSGPFEPCRLQVALKLENVTPAHVGPRGDPKIAGVCRPR